MIEQKRFSLPQIAKAIQQAYIEVTCQRVAKKSERPDYYRGEQIIYGQVYQAKKRAEKEGGEFWIEPSMISSKSPLPWHPKTYDEDQVAGIVDELHEMLKHANPQRSALYTEISFSPQILNKAEEILFSTEDKK